MKPVKNFEKAIGSTLIIGALLLALSGCEGQEGPAEKAGKNVDETTEKLGNQIEKTGDAIQDKAKGEEK